jgi:hypothetical protein
MDQQKIQNLLGIAARQVRIPLSSEMGKPVEEVVVWPQIGRKLLENFFGTKF